MRLLNPTDWVEGASWEGELRGREGGMMGEWWENERMWDEGKEEAILLCSPHGRRCKPSNSNRQQDSFRDSFRDSFNISNSIEFNLVNSARHSVPYTTTCEDSFSFFFFQFSKHLEFLCSWRFSKILENSFGIFLELFVEVISRFFLLPCCHIYHTDSLQK